MFQKIKCPKCGDIAHASGIVFCWCDKDFCTGQRCGADELSREYKCQNPKCGATGTPPETEAYYSMYMPKD